MKYWYVTSEGWINKIPEHIVDKVSSHPRMVGMIKDYEEAFGEPPKSVDIGENMLKEMITDGETRDESKN